jgi:hypothetical protein
MILLLTAICSWVAFGDSYADVAGIFELSTSARATGMGGAFLAIADDESAVFYNPAGLGWINSIRLSSLLARQFGAVNYGCLQFALPYFGAAFLYLDSGVIDTQEQTLRYSSGGGIVSTGFRIGPVGFGGRLKVYRATSPDDGSGWALDPSLLIVTDVIRVGMLVENAYSRPISFDTHTEDWTARTRLGVSLSASPGEDVGLNASVEGAGLFSASPKLRAGVEVYVDGLAARVGYDGAGATFGLSVRFSSFQTDWAYITRGSFPNAHRISISFCF